MPNDASDASSSNRASGDLTMEIMARAIGLDLISTEFNLRQALDDATMELVFDDILIYPKETHTTEKDGQAPETATKTT